MSMNSRAEDHPLDYEAMLHLEFVYLGIHSVCVCV